MDAELLSLAECRGSVVTTAQAAGVDVDEHGLVRLRRTGELVRVRRAPTCSARHGAPVTTGPRFALRTRAVLASRTSRSVASHEAALALHGLPVAGCWPRVVDLLGDVSRVRLVGGAPARTREEPSSRSWRTASAPSRSASPSPR